MGVMKGLVAAVMLAALPVSASLLEDLSGGVVSYQNDAGTHHDAPNDCAAAAAAHHDFPVAWGGNETHAMLVPGEDPQDLLFLNVTSAMVGGRFTVTILDADVETELLVSVRVPDCQSTVMDAKNQPVTPKYPTPASNERLVTMAIPKSWPCAAKWQVSVTHLKGITPPSSVHFVWTSGVQTNAPLSKQAGHEAQYETTADTQHTLRSITMAIDQSWNGTFKVGVGPCNLKQGSAVFGNPATQVGHSFEFTPIHAGRHYVAVGLADPDPEVPSSVPATCHFCFDLGPIWERVSYKVTAVAA